MIYPSALRWLLKSKYRQRANTFCPLERGVIYGTAFPSKASTHEWRSAKIRNARTRSALAWDPRRRVGPNLQRVGTRPHGACWGSGRDIFHVRRAEADLHSLDAALVEPFAEFVGMGSAPMVNIRATWNCWEREPSEQQKGRSWCARTQERRIPVPVDPVSALGRFGGKLPTARCDLYDSNKPDSHRVSSRSKRLNSDNETILPRQASILVTP